MLVIGISAQTNTDFETLRRQVNIPDNDIIRENKGAKLPEGDSLKIYLAIKREGSEAEYFEKWVKEWNKKEGGKRGKLEITQDISAADVVLTQFVTASGEYVKDVSVGVKTVPAYGDLNQNGQSQDNKLKVYGKTDYKSLNLPVYSYLIKRENNLWTIIYRDVETSIPSDQFSNPELRLWGAFKQEMKAR